MEVVHRSDVCEARVGSVRTPHGSFDTPAFMTVGTRGTVKGITPAQLREVGAGVVLNNTYHLMLRPGTELIRDLGGAHRFMGWAGPILTDSGGYQAYSMADINAIDEDGVEFRSIVDGSRRRLGPEGSMAEQNNIGADIIMAFDDCPPSADPSGAPANQTRQRLAAIEHGMRGMSIGDRLRLANERTVRWLERCVAAHARPGEQALFGIVQGGTDLEARSWSASRITSIELPGYAIGGVAVGERAEDIARVVRHTAPLLPWDRPRYLMGVGYERDIVAAVCAGVDMFDCVLPTRNGRNANAFTRTGQIRLRNARFARDGGVLESGCDCPACGPSEGGAFSRAYIRHLFMAEEMLGPILVSLHNLRHFQRLMLDIRRAIREDGWLRFAAAWPVAVAGLPPAIRVMCGLDPCPDDDGAGEVPGRAGG